MTDHIGLSPDDEMGPPRRNGELVFEKPWEGRVFGLAIAMAERGRFEWGAFRSLLVEETAADDAGVRAGVPSGAYYERWYRALERLLSDLGTVDTPELDAAAEAVAAADDHQGAATRGSTRAPRPPDAH
ncbi:MAG: nitrile hydratase accessory protein [Acidimicrobiales bacterium]